METYAPNIVPTRCTKGTVKNKEYNNPLAEVLVYHAREDEKSFIKKVWTNSITQ